jgi:hypothetical protein
MNPYRILNLKPGAGKAEIVKAVAEALRAGEFPAKNIATAQKALLNPLKNLDTLFLTPDFDEILDSINVPKPEAPDFSSLEAPVACAPKNDSN